jgi:plastocyanin
MYRYVAPALLTLASAAVHTVQVGRAGLVFVPETISAVQGDTIVFELFPGHNVVEGDFESPCQTDDDNCTSAAYFPAHLTDADIRTYSLQWTVLWHRQRRQEVCSERHK